MIWFYFVFLFCPIFNFSLLRLEHSQLNTISWKSSLVSLMYKMFHNTMCKQPSVATYNFGMFFTYRYPSINPGLFISNYFPHYVTRVLFAILISLNRSLLLNKQTLTIDPEIPLDPLLSRLRLPAWEVGVPYIVLQTGAYLHTDLAKLLGLTWGECCSDLLKSGRWGAQQRGSSLHQWNVKTLAYNYVCVAIQRNYCIE